MIQTNDMYQETNKEVTEISISRKDHAFITFEHCLSSTWPFGFYNPSRGE